MKNIHKFVISILCLAAAAISVMPIMSAETGNTEYGTLVIRGYNLMEYSALGCVPLLTFILIPILLFGRQSTASKHTETILLVYGNAIFYIHALNSAKEWLRSVSNSSLTYYPGLVLYLGVLILLLFAVIYLDLLSA